MSKKSRAGNNAEKATKAWDVNKQILRLWQVGALIEETEFYQKVENRSLKKCWSCRRRNKAMDLCDSCLKASGREENTPLGANEISPRTSRIAQEVLRRMQSEANMKRMLALRPDFQNDIVEMAINYDPSQAEDDILSSSEVEKQREAHNDHCLPI